MYNSNSKKKKKRENVKIRENIYIQKENKYCKKNI